jgi:hypothetical protein
MGEVQSEAKELSVDETNIRVRVAEIVREVAEIRTANHRYQLQLRHSSPQISLHETRRMRLHEILNELDSLRRSLRLKWSN